MSTIKRWLQSRRRSALPVIGAVPIEAITFVQDLRDGRVLPVARDLTDADTLVLVGSFGAQAGATIRQLRQRMVTPCAVVWLAQRHDVVPLWQWVPIDIMVRGLPPTEADLARAWQHLDGRDG
jgi:coenzyme F420-reducing hydrogenase gamma subunit